MFNYTKHLCFVVGAYLCGLLAFFPQNSFAEDHLRIGTAHTVVGVTLNIAEKEGYFGDLDVELVDLQFGKLTMDGVLSKDVDIGMLVDTNLAFVGFQKNSLKVVAAFATQASERLVLKTEDADLTPSMLRGKKIGYVPATTSHACLHYYLEANGMSMDDIKPTILSPQSMQAALQGGAADGAFIWQPWVFHIEKALPGRTKEFKRTTDFYLSNLYAVTRDDVIKSRPDDLKRLLEAMKKAEDFIQNHPKEALAYTSKFLKLDPEIAQIVLNDSEYHLEMAPRNLEILEKHGKWIQSTQREYKNKQIPDYRPMFDNTLLKTVLPERVTLDK